MAINSLEDSFEILTKEEWDCCLTTDILSAVFINPEYFGIRNGNYFNHKDNPQLPEIIDNHNGEVFSLKVTYGLCRHYFDKGIPDEPFYISDKSGSESIIRYFPNFCDEHWMRRFWFCYFADMFYIKLSSLWDSFLDVIACYFKLDFEKNSGYYKNLLNWFKRNKNAIYVTTIRFQNLNDYKEAKKYRIYAAHGSSVGTIRDQIKVEKNVISEFPVFNQKGEMLRDDTGEIIKRRRNSTRILYSLGDYINSNVLMNNIENITRRTGDYFTEILKSLMTE